MSAELPPLPMVQCPDCDGFKPDPLPEDTRLPVIGISLRAGQELDASGRCCGKSSIAFMRDVTPFADMVACNLAWAGGSVRDSHRLGRPVPCPACGVVYLTGCALCEGTGEVRADPPAKCPWCHGPTFDVGEVVEPSVGCYDCTGDVTGGCYVHRASSIEDADADTVCLDHCPRVPADVAGVVRDLCAERGWDLYERLMGEECVAGGRLPSTGSLWICDKGDAIRTEPAYVLGDCYVCSGTGRVVHEDIRRMLAAVRGGT